jgi:hypothetical protein
MAALEGSGITLRKPMIFRRHGTPGSGGPDWVRNDYEFIVCATRRRGRLPWSDNTAMGHPPKYEPGGDCTNRRRDGSRVTTPLFTNGSSGTKEERRNRGSHRAQRDTGCVYQPPKIVNPGNALDAGYATMEERRNVGPHRARQRAGRVYQPPEKANPGNVIDCVVGGGNMGDKLCHENEAPFPEYLAEFVIRSWCPRGGLVCDPFVGSGTTAAVAVSLGRRFAGCDIRASQVKLTRRRLSKVQAPLPLEVSG